MSEKNKEQLIKCARAGIVIGDGSEQVRALIEELDSRPTVVAVKVGTGEKCSMLEDGIHEYVKRGLVYSIDVGYGNKTWRFESVSLSEITNSDIRYAD